jgi:hypothetical protein
MLRVLEEDPQVGGVGGDVQVRSNQGFLLGRVWTVSESNRVCLGNRSFDLLLYGGSSLWIVFTSMKGLTPHLPNSFSALFFFVFLTSEEKKSLNSYGEPLQQGGHRIEATSPRGYFICSWWCSTQLLHCALEKPLLLRNLGQKALVSIRGWIIFQRILQAICLVFLEACQLLKQQDSGYEWYFTSFSQPPQTLLRWRWL